MKLFIRLENKYDYKETEKMTREAFWNVYKPGCNEHLLLHQLRKAKAFVPELDFVACDQDQIIGTIIYSKANIVNKNKDKFEVLCIGPLGILPSYQKKGVGSKLMHHSLKEAKRLGYRAVILFGNPNYYYRFGFENAKKYSVQTAQGTNFDAFMAIELYEGSLKGVTGKFYADSAFEIDEEELIVFDKQFIPKVKRDM